ncbi:MAG: hypothetical protein ACP5LG_00680 [Conexivisphaera sp.]
MGGLLAASFTTEPRSPQRSASSPPAPTPVRVGAREATNDKRSAGLGFSRIRLRSPLVLDGDVPTRADA